MTAKMAASMVEHGEDAFRKLFKFYKRRNPPPDFNDVIDFSKKVGNELVYAAELKPGGVGEEAASRAGLQPVNEWRAFGLQGFPGFIFISNPFLPGSQHYWVKQCLKTYTQKPNVCNLDMHMSPAETENIWEKSVASIRNAATDEGKEQVCVEVKKNTQRKKGQREPRTLLEKLRWVTLGYHYNWDTKIYSPDHYTPFPEDLHSLSHKVAAACGFPGFDAEAGILNYYRADSSLGIHVDESELDHTRPLLSFSFGQTAVFLLGGTKRQDPPTAMFMRSGDIIVMSGSSRLLYHAVPCIVPAPAGRSLPSCLDRRPIEDDPSDGIVQRVCEKDWEVCSTYLKTSRINMTVRQVLGPGQTFPSTHSHTLTATERSGSGCDEESHVAKKRKSESGYDHDS